MHLVGRQERFEGQVQPETGPEKVLEKAPSCQDTLQT